VVKALAKANAEAAEARLKLKDLEPLAAKAKELEDAQKTETEKLTEALNAAKAEGATSASSLLRVEVALDKAPDGMSAKDVARYAKRLHGSTREELEADAEEFFKDFAGTKKQPPGNKPRETLRGGGDPTAEPEPDISEIVKKIPRL
jgi:hypothetical protein